MKISNDLNKYIEKLFNKNPHLKDIIVKVNKFTSIYEHMLVETIHGECSIFPRHLYYAGNFSIMSAINKTEYFKSVLKLKYGDLSESYIIIGEYVSAKSKIRIQTKYGLCDIIASDLMKGNTVFNIKSAVNKTEYFINMAKEVHGSKYDYSKTKYINSRDDVMIICPIHSDFKTRASSHLVCGCEKCSREISGGSYNLTVADRKIEEFSKREAKLYIIKCSGNNEYFYKIGMTSQEDVKKRFQSNCNMPYSFEIIGCHHGNLYEIIIAEKQLQQMHSEYRYIPKIKFAGYTECFYSIDLNKIKEVISSWNQQ